MFSQAESQTEQNWKKWIEGVYVVVEKAREAVERDEEDEKALDEINKEMVDMVAYRAQAESYKGSVTIMYKLEEALKAGKEAELSFGAHRNKKKNEWITKKSNKKRQMASPSGNPNEKRQRAQTQGQGPNQGQDQGQGQGQGQGKRNYVGAAKSGGKFERRAFFKSFPFGLKVFKEGGKAPVREAWEEIKASIYRETWMTMSMKKTGKFNILGLAERGYGLIACYDEEGREWIKGILQKLSLHGVDSEEKENRNRWALIIRPPPPSGVGVEMVLSAVANFNEFKGQAKVMDAYKRVDKTGKTAGVINIEADPTLNEELREKTKNNENLEIGTGSVKAIHFWIGRGNDDQRKGGFEEKTSRQQEEEVGKVSQEDKEEQKMEVEYTEEQEKLILKGMECENKNMKAITRILFKKNGGAMKINDTENGWIYATEVLEKDLHKLKVEEGKGSCTQILAEVYRTGLSKIMRWRANDGERRWLYVSKGTAPKLLYRKEFPVHKARSLENI